MTGVYKKQHFNQTDYRIHDYKVSTRHSDSWSASCKIERKMNFKKYGILWQSLIEEGYKETISSRFTLERRKTVGNKLASWKENYPHANCH